MDREDIKEREELIEQYEKFRALVEHPAWEYFVTFVQARIRDRKEIRSMMAIRSIEEMAISEYHRGYMDGLSFSVGMVETLVDDLAERVSEARNDLTETEIIDNDD